MIIEHKCCCGAEMKLTDDRGSFINNGGKADEQGRVYKIQVMVDDWLGQHSYCRVNVGRKRENNNG